MLTKPTVFFFCSNEPYNYQHDIVLLAEGLKELGITFFSNENYWQQSILVDDYLFKKSNSLKPENCDVIVFPGNWFHRVTLEGKFIRKELPIDLDTSRAYKVVYLDSNDGYHTVSFNDVFRKFDFILRSHFNELCYYPSNVLPWAFGLPNRIIQEFNEIPLYSNRQNSILCNFGASHGYQHGSRKLAEKKFSPKINNLLLVDTTKDIMFKEPDSPYEKLMWDQCWGRFNRSYFHRLKYAKANMCFCGELISAYPYNPASILVGGKKATIKRELYKLLGKVLHAKPRSIQWDSWRFWESLAAGCVPFHIDLEKYGVALPLMPENWNHYIGIDFDNISLVIDRLEDEPEILEKVSDQGRAWALEHYSPKTVAKRFLKILGYETNE